MVVKNVCKLQRPPKVLETRNGHRAGRARPSWTSCAATALYVPAMVALFTGMRLGRGAGAAMEPRRPRRQGRSRSARRWSRRRRRHRLQDAEVESRPPRHHAAGYPGRSAAGAPQGLLEMRMKLGVGALAGRCAAVRQPRRQAAPAQHRVIGLGRARRAHRHAGSHVPRAAAHPRQPANRQRRGHRHDQQAPGPRQAERHACDLCPHVSTDDSKAAAAINAALANRLGWQSGGNVHICSLGFS